VSRIKTLATVTIALTATFGPVVASADPRPSPPTRAAMLASVRHEVNVKFPADDRAGEKTTCSYVRGDVHDGYAFSCLTSNGTTNLARTKVTMLRPVDDAWRWTFATTPLAHAALGPRVTYRVTATGTTSALDITYNGSSGQVQLTLVPLPFTVTLSHVARPEIFAQSNYGSGKTTITCEIEETGRATIRDTASGSGGVAACD